jgi:peroxiredoxin
MSAGHQDRLGAGRGEASMPRHSATTTGLNVLSMFLLSVAWSGLTPGHAVAQEFSIQSWAPDFSAKDLAGKTVTLRECTAQGPVIVAFWGSWCQGCQNLMAELDRLDQAYRDRGVRVIAVAADDQKTIARVKPMVVRNKWQMTVVTDLQKRISNSFNVRYYPTTYIVTRDQAIAGVYQGYLPGQEKQFEAKILDLLGAAPDTTRAPAR